MSATLVGNEELSTTDVIRVRKAERRQRAEAKRQRDLQRIREMKSAVGIDPFHLFPKEIWAKLFSLLDPKDLENFWRIHPRFRAMLEANRIRDILLPQALQLNQLRHLIRDPENTPEGSENGGECLYGEDFGRIRSVSKSMRNAVDDWVKAAMPWNRDAYTYPGFGVDDMTWVRNLVRNFEGASMRFYPRACAVAVPTWGDRLDDIGNATHSRSIDAFNEFRNLITALLTLVGDQIWQLHVVLGHNKDLECEWVRDEVNLSHVYILFQEWASLLPNLKWLTVELGPVPQNKKVSLPESTTRDHPFPRLSSLECVCFNFGEHDFWKEHGPLKEETVRVFKAVMEANPDIKQLNLVEGNGSKLELLPAQLIRSLPLSILSACLDESEELQLHFQHIRPLINFAWRLKILKLSLHEPSISISAMLQLLERFPTLEVVSLRFERGVKIGCYAETFGYLKLPHLADFGIKMTKPEIDYGDGSDVHKFFSLQFLLHCKKLKTISWTLRGFNHGQLRDHMKKKERSADILDFRAGIKILYQSNIWSVFPELESVQVEIWKLKKGSLDTECEYSCEHEYQRRDVEKGRLVEEFLRLHSCSDEDFIENCVLLYH